jgi:hypothetical protein
VLNPNRPDMHATRSALATTTHSDLSPDKLSSSPRLLDRVRAEIRYRHYSAKTERAYVMWVRRFVHFHKLPHPREMGAAEIHSFLRHLTNDRDVSSSTHNQALSALLFIYGVVLDVKLPWLVRSSAPSGRGGCRSCSGAKRCA